MNADCLPSPSLPVEFLTVEEFAHRMKVSRTTVFSWLKNGELQKGFHYLRLGRIIRFRWHESTFFSNEPNHQPRPEKQPKERKPRACQSETSGVNLDYAV